MDVSFVRTLSSFRGGVLWRSTSLHPPDTIVHECGPATAMPQSSMVLVMLCLEPSSIGRRLHVQNYISSV